MAIPPNLPHLVDGTMQVNAIHLVGETIANTPSTDTPPTGAGWVVEGAPDTSAPWNVS
jgi:hypothetical protein